MLVVALQHCGFDPSFAVGGELNEAGTNAHHGTGDVFVAEADESDGSLLQYDPDVVIVTNVEADHLDFFGTSDAYVQVFDDFVARIAPGGLLGVSRRPGSAALARRTIEAGRDDVRVVGYGTADGVAAAGPVPVGVELVSWEPAIRGVAQIRFAGEDAARTLRLGVPESTWRSTRLPPCSPVAARGVDRRTARGARRVRRSPSPIPVHRA